MNTPAIKFSSILHTEENKGLQPLVPPDGGKLNPALENFIANIHQATTFFIQLFPKLLLKGDFQ